MVSSIQGHFVAASWAIFLAALLDALDGTVARMTGTTSRFGVEYDSLCDLVSFGCAPALLVYQWALNPALFKLHFLQHPGPDEKTLTLGLLVSFIFLACGALRLARFNVSAGQRDPGFFQGLPIPGGAIMLSSMVLWFHRTGAANEHPNDILVVTLILVVSFLMVSNLDYFSLKHRSITKNNHPFETLVLFVLIATLVLIRAKTLLFPLGMVYITSGPIVTLVRYLTKGPVITEEEKIPEEEEQNK
jgi:CDP-diacylglycerol--serine O-phosphatidyltransferase